MEKLSKSMQDRLDRWREILTTNTYAEKMSGKDSPKFASRKNGDDINTLEEWNNEIKLSQQYRR